MNPTTRTVAALGAAVVALVVAYGTAGAACHTLAPGRHRTAVVAPGGAHDPHGGTERDEDGLRPEPGED